VDEESTTAPVSATTVASTSTPSRESTTAPPSTSTETTTTFATSSSTTTSVTTAPPGTIPAPPAVTNAVVERSVDGTQLTISWTQDGTTPASLRWTTDPETFGQPLEVEVQGTSVTVADPAPGERVFFRIAGAGTMVTVAERRIALEGQPNFRDLGGYAAADGRTVKWGQIYRSGELGKLTDADLATLDRIGIALVCDLRSDSEVTALPDPVAAADQQIRLAINDESVDVAKITAAITAGDLSSLSPTLLLDGMPKIALDFSDNWRDLLLRVGDPANRPTNFHCSAGKDRAGWASAVILRALGVPEETVMADYLLSNDYRAEANAATVAQVRTLVAGVSGVPEDEVDMSNLVALLEVRPEYLQAALDAVDEKFGSFDAYLTDGLGLTEAQITALRDSLLE
jgi:protein-tyrosine phosphatase